MADLQELLRIEETSERITGGELALRENSLAIMNGEQPDAYLDFMATMDFIWDPILAEEVLPPDGVMRKDPWGTTKVCLPGAPGAHPVINDKNKVIKDLDEWESELVLPNLDNYDWTIADATYQSIDRGEKFVGFFCATGIFERSHFLMGMEDALCAYMEDDDDHHPMYDMLGVIADWKIKQIEMMAEKYHPDVIFYQDDWGSKQNLFLSPALWRKTILPHQKRIAKAIKDCGMMYVHHADCICEPIVDDMVELGIDIWQGVIPENDIVGIQKHIKEKYGQPGKMCIQGGIDTPRIDFEGASQELVFDEIHRAVDTYCAQGYMFPGFPGGGCLNGGIDEIARPELLRYGIEYAKTHPVA